jgi:hypothetical protein
MPVPKRMVCNIISAFKRPLERSCWIYAPILGVPVPKKIDITNWVDLLKMEKKDGDKPEG